MERKYAIQRIIKDIKNDDVRIQITGYVKEIKNEIITLDDKSGNIRVDFKEAIGYVKNISKNDLINVIGDLNLSMDGAKVITAQIIQDMNKLNFTYYKKLYEIRKELL